jgi:Flp pilus assembly secretin CpaC
MAGAVVALVLAWVLVCPEAWAQTQTPKPAGPVDPRAMVKPDPKKAKRLAELGSKEEAGGAYSEALASYEEAARYAPFDVTIVNLAVSLRSRLVRGYMDDAEQRAIAGDLDGATQQLATALHLDPTNSIVLERLQQMELMKGDAKDQPPQEPPIGMPQLKPEHSRQDFRIQDDVRTVYERVAAAYGIRAAFDPDLPARTVRLRLEDADFDTAIKVLSAETGTFWHTLNAKLIFVAADTSEKRRAFEPEIEQTFYLPASSTSTEMTEVVRAVRDLTGAQRIQQSAAAHSVTIRDTVPKVRLAGAIINNLEKAPGEVLLEIDLLEVDRDNAAKLGITPPAKLSLYSVSPALASQLRSATSITQLLTILASVFGTAASGGLTSLASAIPPIAAIGGGKSTFLLALPTFAADFSQSLSLVHSGRQVLLRAQDGKPATFFVGDRYPITLSLLSASLGGAVRQTPAVGGTSTAVQTEQFTVGQGPVSLTTADFRNAGSQDLAVLNEIDNTVTILLNQGGSAVSQFAEATGSPISLGAARAQAPAVPPAIASGSLNSATDSLPDLLVTDPVANTVTVLLETTAGDGTFTIQKNRIAVGNEPSAIAVGTFNSNTNSNLGFLVTNFADNTYSVFLGNGDGTFTQATGSPFALPSTATGPIAVSAADFNADGILDLAILNQTTKNVTILQGKGDGTFTEFAKSPIAVGNGPVAIASGSLGGSTGPALAIANQTDNTVTVYLGHGDGSFTESSQSPLTTSKAPAGIVISDFAQQSAGGIAVTNRDSGTVTVFVDLGNGLFTSALEPAAGSNPTAIVSGDFTGHAFPDVVVTNNIASAAGQVTLLISPASLIAGSTIGQQPYPGSEYLDIGLKIKATPTLHPNKEVTLQMDFDIKSLAGSAVNQIPIISNRSMTQVIRLRENETSIVSGLLNLQESKSITGIPGLAKIPGVGYAFGARDNSFTNDELLILITPRRVRMPVRESQSFYAGRGELGGGRASLGGTAVAQPGQPGEEPPQPQPAETQPETQQPVPQPAVPTPEQPEQPNEPQPQPPQPQPQPPQPQPQPPQPQPQPPQPQPQPPQPQPGRPER